jgi:hypothetical protein
MSFGTRHALVVKAIKERVALAAKGNVCRYHCALHPVYRSLRTSCPLEVAIA